MTGRHWNCLLRLRAALARGICSKASTDHSSSDSIKKEDPSSKPAESGGSSHRSGLGLDQLPAQQWAAWLRARAGASRERRSGRS